MKENWSIEFVSYHSNTNAYVVRVSVMCLSRYRARYESSASICSRLMFASMLDVESFPPFPGAASVERISETFMLCWRRYSTYHTRHRGDNVERQRSFYYFTQVYCSPLLLSNDCIKIIKNDAILGIYIDVRLLSKHCQIQPKV